MFMKVAAAAMVLALALPAAAQEIDPAKREDILRLLEITGSSDMMMQSVSVVMPQMRAMLKAQQPQMTDEQIARFESYFLEELRAVTPQIMAEIVAVYDRNYTRQEIQDITAFYETPTGRKTLEVMPTILAESMAASQQWTMMASQKAVARLTEDMRDGS